jgi:benzoylformate decarboxylase
MFGIHGLWSAGHYRVGTLFVVLKNGGYRIMDQLAARQGGAGAWPSFGEIEIASIARSLGCDSQRVATFEELTKVFDDVLPALRDRNAPLLLEVDVEPD